MNNLKLLPHLQFAVLRELTEFDLTGNLIRELLKTRGIFIDGPRFYQLMDRLKKARFVSSKFVCLGDYRECQYHLLAKGEKAIDESMEFYRSQS